MRCRDTFQGEILRSRHYVLKFLRRRGLVYRGNSNWTEHREWLNTVASSAEEISAEDRMVLMEYLALLDYKIGRRAALDQKVEEIALSPRYREIVSRLRCFRGIDTQSAMVLATELHDLRHFQNSRQLMPHIGRCHASTHLARDEARAPSPRPGTPTADMSLYRRRGRTATDRR